MTPRIAVTLLVVSLAAAACGGGDSSSKPAEQRPLTFDEAAKLAAVQVENLRAGGAAFIVNTTFLTTGDTLVMQGEIDWVTHEGHALVSGKGAEAGVAEVYWTTNDVLERRPVLTQLLAGRGYGDIQWVVRPPAPDKRLLDRAIAVLVALSSEQPDNAALILQKPGTAWVRQDQLRNRDVWVLRYGDRNLYWVDPVTFELQRFEGNSESLSAPILVDIISRGAQQVQFPLAAEVVDVSRVQELYDLAVTAAASG